MARIDSLPRKMVLPEGDIWQADALTILESLDDESVDCVFADPPYFLQLGGVLTRPDNSIVDGVTESWDHFESLKAYDDFTRAWLRAVRRVLKKDGSIWVIGSYHNIFRVGSAIQDEGFWLLNDVIWRKSNPMPNFRGTRFTNAHETLIWAAKTPQAQYTFNYQSMKQLNDEYQMRSDWVLPICSGKERLRDEHGKKLHPTQKPESLLYRIILASTKPGEVILDPFFGSGTTGAVAKKLGRRFIGIEQDRNYSHSAYRRIKNIAPLEHDLCVPFQERRQQSRIPFGWLIERGLLNAGQFLFDQSRRFQALIHADGTVWEKSNNIRGSIHKVGAALQQAPSCNGWTYWHFESSKSNLAPLDVLRERLRSELH